MLRSIHVLITVAACLWAGIEGAIAGMGVELQTPLSAPSHTYAVRWGTGAGVLCAFIAVGVLLSARRERLWWLTIVAAGSTLILSFAGMWFKVVSGLG